ncbi:aldehyde dehydrogenase family protein, partial [Mesorhizobium sp. M1A.F.Ca.IN.022.05.2.1]|uniref:aldehyde dehydrogenase family protein n=3 Tax=unclassified Mesorhizobium TaxID=325217 RepID=UPI001FE133C8
MYDLYYGGQLRKPNSGRYFESENPATGEVWSRVAEGNASDVDAAVKSAHECWKSAAWRDLRPTERGKLLVSLAGIIEREAERIAGIEMRDNGKLATEVRSQVRYTAEYYRYYGGLADKIQGAVVPTDKKGVFAYTKYEPKGVVAIITPWNSPLTLTTWKLAPALAAGCAAVIKPSEFTSASVIEFAQLFAEAGFPAGSVNVVTGGGAVGAALVSHKDVAHVGFTGGEEAGTKVYELAARGLKTVTLELGGKSPNIVFDDADLDQAVKGAISGIFAASGQQCVAGSRLLVQRSIHDAFVERLLDVVKRARIGDPSDAATNIGPIATRPQFEKILRYIEIGKSEGATCLLGGGQYETELGG